MSVSVYHKERSNYMCKNQFPLPVYLLMLLHMINRHFLTRVISIICCSDMLRYSKPLTLGVLNFLFASFNRFTAPTFMECVNNKVLGAGVVFLSADPPQEYT